jgi:hypothetical protein
VETGLRRRHAAQRRLHEPTHILDNARPGDVLAKWGRRRRPPAVATLGAALDQARRKARDLAFESAEGRLADLLLYLVGGGGPSASAGEPRLARLFAARDRRTIHDVDRLRRIARFCEVD